MDLTDILRKRTETDLRVAMARTLKISFEIEAAANELKELRAELRALERAKAKREPQPAAPLSTRPSSAVARPLSFALLRKLVRRRARPEPIQWHLDEIAGVFPRRDKDGVSAEVSSTGQRSMTLSGWVVPMEGHPSFASVSIALIGRLGSISREVQTHARADVASHFGNSDYVSCGFRFDIPMFDIPAGNYVLELSARSLNGKQVVVRAGTIEVGE
jgi:hypothetical protein